uniref:Rieske domain-containing protein n=1 Tax=Chromera velia CCMP2878 TaxID=1169474 RepID=A0A0G4I663_9ALVE|eukprot:Cvel_11327.t1-p1 / transcript=Cvel_11327.t1 / gene=Cvel_11327 / organism=Chromera_velia_CCMP2878 / gene_product=Nitrite reductase [NAD(P)H] large subunit, putative / transcript_product=Nitrite reductase [NAD(P)H] large subunit, putative / location=Cvel_scaffold709:10554-20969(+) / protein_length=1103 / sequence_SO=supercontig / SO=protein_coding / is_pseudo=false
MSEGKKKVVVLGNGPVGHKFLESLVELDGGKHFELTVFCEESRHAYDRVKITSFFEHRDPVKLSLCDRAWFEKNGIEFINERATKLNKEQRMVNDKTPYDFLVFATGSYAFVRPTPGLSPQTPGVFVYRTIEDMEAIIRYAEGGAKTAGVIGGGLLGLEAAKAVADLGLEAHVLERSKHLMPRQLDLAGGMMLTRIVRDMGLHVHLETKVLKVNTTDAGVCSGVEVMRGDSNVPSNMPLDMIIISTGIRPRDELAEAANIALGERGGVKVDGRLRSSDPRVFAVGEAASHEGTCYGLWAPGVQQVGVLVHNLIAEAEGKGDEVMREYSGSDVSTKLKLLGTDVASLGATTDFFTFKQWDDKTLIHMVHEDQWSKVYKKLVFNLEGTKLMGALLVGDASSFGKLLGIAHKGDMKGKTPPELLLLGSAPAAGSTGGTGTEAVDDDELVCSCVGVTAGMLRQAVADGLHDLEDIKKQTKCGTGCGGCISTGPVKGIIASKLKELGIDKKEGLCGCIPFSRKEVFDIVKVKGLRSFKDILSATAEGREGRSVCTGGCEICKPAVASILASLWNEHILEKGRNVLQDTNDRFLANIQRNGTYSVIPRIAGGEITPKMLKVIAEVGDEYGLYTKVTGGQRIDLFGAQRRDLPVIWKKLVEAGFESGHAYAKSLRTVKSCVGSTWCRYGMQDSVTFAVRLENRYKGLRSPHKLKGGVSGCVRECAEAQGKDFGVVATDKGWNLYVCGNGGARPAHAQLLVSDVDDDTCIKIIDRFLMFYIATAEPLQRTARWIEKLEGGLAYLRSVVVDDKLGISSDLEAMMEESLGNYECEWKRVVENPELWSDFQQYANGKDPDDVELEHQWVDMRGQIIPAPWLGKTGNFMPSVGKNADGVNTKDFRWVDCGRAAEFPKNGGAAVKYGESQLAVFCFADRKGKGQDEWFACQNMCPHKRAFVLARGLVGEAPLEGGHLLAPKVACPHHKRAFDLQTGTCLNDETMKINTFDVKIEDGRVLLHLPPESAVDEALATSRWTTKAEKGMDGDAGGGGNAYMVKRRLKARTEVRLETETTSGNGQTESLNGSGVEPIRIVTETFGADGGTCNGSAEAAASF